MEREKMRYEIGWMNTTAVLIEHQIYDITIFEKQ